MATEQLSSSSSLASAMTPYCCRHCGSRLPPPFLDLGHQPPSNAYRTAEQLEEPELSYPLRLYVCPDCWLVQIPAYASAQTLFQADYAYFSSVSSSWVEHSRRYVAQIVERCGLGSASWVVELAANDGYLLQFMVQRGVPCLGIEPTAATAAAARGKGIPVEEVFFGLGEAQRLAAAGQQADLVIGNNVLAHVPDVNDFVAGIKALLKPGGVVTLEFPHLLQLLRWNQFDTVYHEHFSYFSLGVVQRIFGRAGLEVFDVEELPTHGGSLRVYGQHPEARAEGVRARVGELVERERGFGLEEMGCYGAFQGRVDRLKDEFVGFLLEAKRAGRSICGYGAAAKGNTLLNYGGVKRDLLPWVCDAALSKQGKFLPGSHIPIVAPSFLEQNPPDILLVLPWNLATEIRGLYQSLANRGTQFVTVIPQLQVL
ncbi:class I SAM-dependent methyltransferase [Prochlorothrix hollandica]|uniref:SAM-dependent methyltransferase n=1 Tax=Prochlorothrix hollandica PCC 9006 = CALU 1027 TaxID=317619 RepID=A0A0M2PRG8_PROHO|nr:class I SAM-dependent methyltransferase [Prochlorothrix hollandica]KKI99140.1 SAM-dependent methyltransferase [Prochlorothrix hollandica PCC 9006 = CALU 1027]